MDRMHISTIIVCVGSSTVLATGSFGWQYNASNGVVFVGVLARILVFVCRRIGTLSQLTQTLGEKIHLTSCKLLSQLATGAAA